MGAVGDKELSDGGVAEFTCAGELVMSVLPPDVDVTVVAGHHF